MTRKYKPNWDCPVCFLHYDDDPVFLISHLSGGHSKEDLERYILQDLIKNWKVIEDDGKEVKVEKNDQ